MKRRGFTLPTMKKGEKKKRGIEKDVNGRRRKTRRRFDASVPVEYVNWMHGDDDDDRKMVKTWKEYVECIGDEKLKAFPVVQQAKNDCSLCAAITCWEVQQQRKFMKTPDQLGSYKKTREEGAHLADQVPRVWGRGTGRSRPYSMCKHKMRLRLEELIEHVRRGVVYMGLEQLGYPWANRAVSLQLNSVSLQPIYLSLYR